MKVLERRMMARGDSPDNIRNRLESDAIAFGTMPDFCDVIFRNAGDKTVTDIAAAVIEYMRFREKCANITADY